MEDNIFGYGQEQGNKRGDEVHSNKWGRQFQPVTH